MILVIVRRSSAAEAESLWPAEPQRIKALRAWIIDAEKLEQNLAGHVQVRDALRMSPAVLPNSEEHRALDAVRLQPVTERREAAAKEHAEEAAPAALASAWS